MHVVEDVVLTEAVVPDALAAVTELQIRVVGIRAAADGALVAIALLLGLLGLLLLFILAFLLLRLRPFCHLLFVAKEDLRELSEGDIDGLLQEGAVVLTDIVAYILVGHTDGELVTL